MGIVVGREDADRLGRTPAERLERAITVDAWLSSIAGGAKRVTSVATYSNYQLISQRGYGPGWVMVGDAFGFVDVGHRVRGGHLSEYVGVKPAR